MVDVHRDVALRFGRLRLILELLRLFHDLGLFVGVAFGLRTKLFGRLAGRKNRAELSQVLLAAFRLVEVPLIGRLGLLDRRVVLVEERFVLRRAAHVAEQRADRCEDRGHHGNPPRKRVAGMRRMLDLVIVRAMYVKSVFGHRCLPCQRKCALGCSVQAAVRR